MLQRNPVPGPRMRVKIIGGPEWWRYQFLDRDTGRVIPVTKFSMTGQWNGAGCVEAQLSVLITEVDIETTASIEDLQVYRVGELGSVRFVHVWDCASCGKDHVLGFTQRPVKEDAPVEWAAVCPNVAPFPGDKAVIYLQDVPDQEPTNGS